MATIYITRAIPDSGLRLLADAGHEVIVSQKDGVLSAEELETELRKHAPSAVISLLTDAITGDIFDAAPQAKIFANYAVGYDNIDLTAARERGVVITNTPGVLTDSVAEHTAALIFAITKRIPEADRFTRAGKYAGWAPMLLLGSDLKNKVLGILGAGRIGSRVAEILGAGAKMRVIYNDIKQSPDMERATGAQFRSTVEAVLAEADVVSIHVPLLDATRHLLNASRLRQMKPTAYLVNTSRGPVIDEAALVDALRAGVIRGAALDVFENEPTLTPGLVELDNVIVTPHTASATEETRALMSELAAQNVLAFLAGKTPPHVVNT